MLSVGLLLGLAVMCWCFSRSGNEADDTPRTGDSESKRSDSSSEGAFEAFHDKEEIVADSPTDIAMSPAGVVDRSSSGVYFTNIAYEKTSEPYVARDENFEHATGDAF